MDDNNLSFDDIIYLINNQQSSELKAVFESKSFQDINLKNDDSLLMRACKIGNEEIVMVLLGNGANISFESQHSGHTALSLACLHGHESIVKILLEHKADPNSPRGHLPLVKSCEADKIEIVKLLLGVGAKVNTMPSFLVDKSDDDYDSDYNTEELGPQCRGGPNALMVACSKGNLELAQLLLDSGSRIDDSSECRDETYGFTALTYACRGYHWELVKLLVGLGAAVEDWRDCGYTPLMYACAEGNLDAVEMLLDLGADINQAEYGYDNDPLAETPLSSACLHGHLDLAKFILEHIDFTIDLGVVQRAFIDACEHGDAEIIALLRPRLGDLNDLIVCKPQPRRAAVRTLFTVACEVARIKAAQKLLELGATVSMDDDQGHTALTAIWMGGPLAMALITLLVEHGADVNSVDSEGNTPLMIMAGSFFLPKSSEGFKALLDYGADVRVKNRKGQTVFDTFTTGRSRSWRRCNELEALCRQYEESNRRDRAPEETLLK